MARLRNLALAIVSASAMACLPSPPGASGTPGTSTRPAPCAGTTCWVAVNVATLWSEPSSPRPVDAPSLGNPAHPRQWVRAMSVAQKSSLVGKLETQVLYGTRVLVVGRAGTSWLRVVVPDQPTPRDSRGYPGFVPARQLSGTPPRSARVVASVRTRTAWLWTGWRRNGVAGQRRMELSFGTRLPVVRAARQYVVVSTLGGTNAAIRRSAVSVQTKGARRAVPGRQLVDDAKRFLGLPYLWAGTSGFGFDCSGLTYELYRAVGIAIPRDAEPQDEAGRAVARRDLRPGDLVFFRTGPAGPVDHVGLFAGYGQVIDSPHTGAVVRLEPLSSFPDFAGARRFLPA